MMPVMDGLDMVKAIKADHDTCHIPIILLSAKSSLDDRIAGLEQGIDDYITKPFSSTYLKTRILSLLRQRKQLQDLYLSKLSEHTQEEDHINGWEPSQPQVTPYDEQFMQQVMAFMEEQMDNTDITIDDFANKLMLSRTVFYRKLKSIVGLTPVDFVCEMRIKRAAQLIEKSEYSFSQIAYMTGFNDPKYFSRRFKKSWESLLQNIKKEREMPHKHLPFPYQFLYSITIHLFTLRSILIHGRYLQSIIHFRHRKEVSVVVPRICSPSYTIYPIAFFTGFHLRVPC